MSARPQHGAGMQLPPCMCRVWDVHRLVWQSWAEACSVRAVCCVRRRVPGAPAVACAGPCHGDPHRQPAAGAACAGGGAEQGHGVSSSVCSTGTYTPLQVSSSTSTGAVLTRHMCCSFCLLYVSCLTWCLRWKLCVCVCCASCWLSVSSDTTAAVLLCCPAGGTTSSCRCCPAPWQTT